MQINRTKAEKLPSILFTNSDSVYIKGAYELRTTALFMKATIFKQVPSPAK